MYTEIRCGAIIAPARGRQERECEPVRAVAKREELAEFEKLWRGAMFR
ncbi:hypothetical protein CFter6_5267 [Collimonas fungivorans]|jgi:hypothetical protein|uniref:Uncharacterized protein n=1 Tax=Collimonas fungivorans TaxID=158899 RepID=A0A127PJN3_9BURK|nr:hypothetical protein CFter6_5267 [Collimonas fungivorans]